MPGELVPNYRPQVTLYTAIAPLALLYNRSLLDTLHERVGEETHMRGRQDLPDADGPSAVWSRVLTMDGKRDSRRGVYGTSPSYDYEFLGLQVGTDLIRRQRDDGHRDVAGTYLAFGRAEATPHVNGHGVGQDNLDGYSVGGYWTHFGPTDWYLDGILQATYYDISAEPDNLAKLDVSGWGWAASLEGGYPFQLPEQWVVEPQAQVVYQRVGLDDTHDAAATVKFDEVDSLASRLGVRVAKTWDESAAPEPHKYTAWGRLSAWHESQGEPETKFSSADGYVPFQGDLGGGWWEAKLGLTGEVRRNVFVYASVGYERAFDDERHAVDGKLGVRVQW
ncbi:autotransporter outer membrane beta-barrel domain-containing protein [Pseudomonas sp. PDNC002]|uniref:autotransporter family protein n=1 Tax=Pseudomonas sp. PDNC002 TaxID=2811422 RepID=UPI001965B83B|nr:autotransporter outer membrane beta-barrel domain-containing protein [Pseudomonas sp. PDNC002]QRY79358.1 autotransporter outer membrane beta-barrel domain-containing protein [Pseudomonas sp. PDNC002]